MENTHVSALHAKHHAIEAKIRDEQSRPKPDGMLLSQMKKRKLLLKEALANV